MNFDDPFANDLGGFNNTVAALRRPPAAASSVDGALGNRRTRNPDVLSLSSPPGTSSHGAGSAIGIGVPSPAPMLSRREASWNGSAPASVPVAGRRAAAVSGTSGSSSAALSGGPPVIPVQPSAFLSSARAPASDPLPWFTDVDDASPRASGAPGFTRLGSEAALPQSRPAMVQPVAVPSDDVVGNSFPSFLDFRAERASAGLQLQEAFGVRAAPTGIPSASPAAASAAAEAERKKKELRDLYASLDALELEQQHLEERLDDAAVKEETELITLDTSILVKTAELEEKEQEQLIKKAELKQHTEERLASLAERYRKEMNDQAAEVRQLDGGRFQKQLQTIEEKKAATMATVRELQEKAALLLLADPYSEKAVRVALSTAADDAVTAAAESSATATPIAGNHEHGDSASVGAASSRLDGALGRAVSLLRGYCSKRLQGARDKLVDYVHTQTLDTAHSIRRERERAWMEDAVKHKSLFSQYMQEMMLRYMSFYKERALLKQENVNALQTSLRDMAGRLRTDAAERVKELLNEVTAKMTLSTERHINSTEEAYAQLQKKCFAVMEGDLAIADTQRKELESRMFTEEQARRQRILAEEESLKGQLQRLQRSGEESTSQSFQALRNAVASTGSQPVVGLREEVLAFKTRLLDRLHRNRSAVISTSSVPRMQAEELLYTIRNAISAVSAQQKSLSLSSQRCAELRQAVSETVSTDVVQRLQKARSVQHTHRARIDAQMHLWEAAHRQNLAAACSIALPVSGSTAGTADGIYVAETFAAPQDVASTAFLDILNDRLLARDEVRRAMRASRQNYTALCTRKLEDVRAEQVVVHEKWDALWSRMVTHVAEQDAAQCAALETERSLIEVTAEARMLERDRRTTERQSHRIAGAMTRLRRDAALYEAPLQLPYAAPETTLVLARQAMGSSGEALPLRSLNLNAQRKIPGNNTFTAVNASTNARNMSSPIQAAEPLQPRYTSAPSLNESSTAAKGRSGGLERTPSSRSQPCRLYDVTGGVEPNDTQTWSSALLRAERQLPLSSPGSASDAFASPQREGCSMDESYPTTASSGGGTPAASLSRGTPPLAATGGLTRHLHVPHDASDGLARSSSARNSLRDPNVVAAERQQSGSSSSLRQPPLPPASSSLTDSGVAPLLQSSSTPLSSQAWPERQQPPSAQANRRNGFPSLTTWSTLDEYRSSTGPSHRPSGEGDVSNVSDDTASTTPGTADDTEGFLALLSCLDSPSSSSLLAPE